jgi:hypothetical protein
MDVLTWKQFKEAVDAELKKKGISEDTEIFYIDTGNCPEKDELNVWQHTDGSIAID